MQRTSGARYPAQAIAHPTMRRLNTSRTTAKNTNPAQVGT